MAHCRYSIHSPQRTGAMFCKSRTILFTACLTCATTALAEKPGFGDAFTFRIGAMDSRADAIFRYTDDGRPETELDLSDLGMDDSKTALWLGGTWQFTDRWSLGFTYNKFDSDGENVSEYSGNFGDVNFTVGSTLTSSFTSKLYIVDLTWDFLKTDNAHLGIGIGAHVADLSAELGATISASINGNPTMINFGTDTATVTAPLPNVSLIGGFTLGDQVYVRASAGYFSLNYNEYDGELLSVRAGIEWRPFDRFGVGAGYQYVQMDLQVDNSRSDEKYEIDLYGPFVFLSVGL